MRVAEVGVVQTLQNLTDDSVGIDASVVPGLNDGIDSVLDNDLGDLSCGLVENIVKVVLIVS